MEQGVRLSVGPYLQLLLFHLLRATYAVYILLGGGDQEYNWEPIMETSSGNAEYGLIRRRRLED